MRRRITIVFTALATMLALPWQVSANPTPEDAYAYREAVMTTLKGHVGAASLIARGLIENRGQLRAHAQGLSNGAAELVHLFPDGSNVGESEALPVIWDKPEKFAKAIETLLEATAAFEKAAAGGDEAAIGATFRDVGMACRGCHDNFRKSDD